LISPGLISVGIKGSNVIPASSVTRLRRIGAATLNDDDDDDDSDEEDDDDDGDAIMPLGHDLLLLLLFRYLSLLFDLQ